MKMSRLTFVWRLIFFVDFGLLWNYNICRKYKEREKHMILQGYFYSILYAILCLAIGFGLYKLRVDKKITRKVVHILVGAEWLILYHFFGGGIHFLVVCLLFLALLFAAHRLKLMPMISSDGENSPGTVYYALAMSIMALITLLLPDMILPFGIGVFCTSLGDGFAGMMGQIMNTPKNPKIYGNKTIYGTLFNFLLCFITAGVFNRYFALGMQVWHILAIALIATELELFTGRGLDNVTVTLGASILSYFFIHFDGTENYVFPILMTPAIIAFAYKKRALTVSGIIAATVLDLAITIGLGNLGFIILLLFFAGGIIVDKIKKRHKKSKQNEQMGIEKRGDCRDHIQVLANGAVAAVCSVLYLITGKEVFVIAFVASLAEAFADTAASGIGILQGRAFDLFRMRHCTPGVSGGMSVLGTVASAIASLTISAISLLFDSIGIIAALLIAISSILGAIFDSLLGSLVQVKYRCKKCGQIVEREEHCGQATEKQSGLCFVNNDTVNLLGTLFSAILAAILYTLLA